MNATQDHRRVCPDGIKIGGITARAAEAGVKLLINHGEPDTRCKTCAFRTGTVPNGCYQTQLDALKATSEGVTFYCHHAKKGEQKPICHGWYASRVFMRQAGMDMNIKAPWDFSSNDETPA